MTTIKLHSEINKKTLNIKKHIIRTCDKYVKCEIAASNINKLCYVLGLYDTIEALIINIDEPLSNYNVTHSFNNIKHLCIRTLAKYYGADNMLHNNFWLLFPNLETLIVYELFIPTHDLDTLVNLNTFKLYLSHSMNIRKTLRNNAPNNASDNEPNGEPNRTQKIVDILTHMHSLINITIDSNQQCNVTDLLFQNNKYLCYIYFGKFVVCNNISSILKLDELKILVININILTNLYVLELTNLEYFNFSNCDPKIIESLPDELFTKPIFNCCKFYCSLVKYHSEILRDEAVHKNYYIWYNKNEELTSYKTRIYANGYFSAEYY